MNMRVLSQDKVKVGNKIGKFVPDHLIVAVHSDYIWVTRLFNDNATVVGGKVEVKPLRWKNVANGMSEVFFD